jgi:hypothetical protein
MILDRTLPHHRPPALRQSAGTLRGQAEMRLKNLVMVEAVGVEPTSETTFNREHSCFSAFIFVSSSPLGTGEETMTTSLISFIPSAQTEQLGPAYCATIGTGP